MTPLLELRNVRKTYGTHRALNDLSLDVNRGEVVALLGPNGAGKTTALEIVLGLRHADSGEVRLRAKSVGVTPQETGMPQNLRVSEIVDFVERHYRARSNVPDALRPFGLENLARRQAGGLSGGELRRLALALAFASNPELVILDEPTTGLDVEARRKAWQHVRDYVRAGGTVLLTTHHMEEAEALATRICVISAGKIVRDASPEDIRRTVTSRKLTYTGAPFDPAQFGIEAQVDVSGSRVTIAAGDTDALVRAMVSRDVPFSDLCIAGGSLEDAVLAIAEGAS